MADIAAANVTYTLNSQDYVKGLGYVNRMTIAFGNGSLTYPSGGIPLTLASLELPAGELKEFRIEEDAAGNGLIYKYDKSALKIRIYEADTTGDADKPLVELDAASDAPAAVSLEVVVVGY